MDSLPLPLPTPAEELLGEVWVYNHVALALNCKTTTLDGPRYKRPVLDLTKAQKLVNVGAGVTVFLSNSADRYKWPWYVSP